MPTPGIPGGPDLITIAPTIAGISAPTQRLRPDTAAIGQSGLLILGNHRERSSLGLDLCIKTAAPMPSKMCQMQPRNSKARKLGAQMPISVPMHTNRGLLGAGPGL